MNLFPYYYFYGKNFKLREEMGETSGHQEIEFIKNTKPLEAIAVNIQKYILHGKIIHTLVEII